MNPPKPLTVFFFPAWYPHRGDPMFGLFVKRHAEAVSSVARVGVVFAFGEVKSGPLFDLCHTEESGVSTLRIYYRKCRIPFLGTWVNAFLYLAAVFRGYRKLKIRLGTPDVNHIHVLTRAGVVPLWLKITHGTPFLITEHWSRYLPENRGDFSGFLRKWITRRVVGQASFVTPVSEKLAAAMRSHGLRNPRYELVNNVVDTERFIPGTHVHKECLRWVHVSCMDDRPKNLKGLLDGFARAHAADNRISLQLVGDGVDFNQIRHYAMEKDPHGKLFRFSGMLEGEALLSAFQHADAFVMFSRYENQPVVITEAFSCGLPVVATGVGAIPDMLSEGRGTTVPSEDVQALSDEVLLYAAGQVSFSREAIRQYAVDNFSYGAVAGRFRELYLATLQSAKTT